MDEPRILTEAELDRLTMEQIDKITAHLPIRDYRTPSAPDGTSSHIILLENGGRFEIFYDGEGKPFDFRFERVRFQKLGTNITLIPGS